MRTFIIKYNQRKKKCHNGLHEKLNCYHLNIKLTIESNPNKFLDTEIIEEEDIIYTVAYRKVTKIPVP